MIATPALSPRDRTKLALEQGFRVLEVRVLPTVMRAIAWTSGADIEDRKHRAWAVVKRKWLVLVGVSIVGMLLAYAMHLRAAPATCGPGSPGFIDNASTQISGLMTSWPSALIGSFSAIFWSIWVFAVTISLWFEIPPTRGDLGMFFLAIARCFLVPLVAATLFTNGPTVAPALLDMMISAGGDLPSSSSVSPDFKSLAGIAPGDAFMKFACVASKIEDSAYSKATALDFLKQPVATLLDAAAVIFGIVACYLSGALVMVCLFMFKMEALFVVGIGSVLLVGLAATALYSFPMRYLGALVGLGLHGIALSFLAGVMLGELRNFDGAFTVSAGTPVPPHALFLAGCVLVALAFMIWKLPELLSSIGGTAGFTPSGGFASGMAFQSLMNSFGRSGGSKGGGSDEGGDGGEDSDGGGGPPAATEASASEVELVAAA